MAIGRSLVHFPTIARLVEQGQNPFPTPVFEIYGTSQFKAIDCDTSGDHKGGGNSLRVSSLYEAAKLPPSFQLLALPRFVEFLPFLINLEVFVPLVQPTSNLNSFSPVLFRSLDKRPTTSPRARLGDWTEDLGPRLHSD